VTERGSVTVVVAAMLAAALVLAVGAADLARVFAASARAQTAADAAALAAAQELALPGGREPASVAGEYATLNGGSLAACGCEPGGFEATVEVRLPVGTLLLFPDDRVVIARARAVVDLPAPSPTPTVG